MALNAEQVKQLKDQLREQIKHLPEAQKAQAQKQIDDLSPEALEDMIEQQKKRSEGNQKSQERSSKGVFRLIASKEIPSAIVDENPAAIAVLDINPISKGHTLIIPKKKADKTKALPSAAFTLARKIAKILSIKLKAKAVAIATEEKFDEVIINVLPSYEKQLNLDSPRSTSKLEELQQLANQIKPGPVKKKPIKIEKAPSQKATIVLPRRVP